MKKPTKTETTANITECRLQSVEKWFHLKIVYENDEYFYIVKTLDVRLLKDKSDIIVSEIRRGHAYWDCQKHLKNSEKKKIKAMITDYVTENYEKLK
ncbi:MAG: hypothetical protein WC755_09530 [Candidatus Woesearchaeota archaeon]|jgi:hypothetical protein